MRFASSGSNSAISRKLGTCRSGITSRWTSARGLMSVIATTPGAARTWSPSLYSRQKRQSFSPESGSENALLRDRGRADTDELADRHVDEPRRVIVSVTASRTIDNHVVVRAELRAPAVHARLVRDSAEPRTSVPLETRRSRVVGGRPTSRARRIGKDVDLRDPRLADGANGPLE